MSITTCFHAIKKHRTLYWLSGLLLCLALILADQASKQLALRYLKDGSHISLIPGLIGLDYVENRGMAFGLLQNAIPLFAVTTLLICSVLVYAFLRLPENKKFRPLSLACVFIFAGAVGNLIDRLGRGYVVDFLELEFITFPVFNIADCYVTWTAVVVAVLILLVYKDSDFEGI